MKNRPAEEAIQRIGRIFDTAIARERAKRVTWAAAAPEDILRTEQEDAGPPTDWLDIYYAEEQDND